MTTRAVIYARQSLDRTGEGAAVDRQVTDCRRLAEARGWEVTEVISDNDMSASTGKRRPGYERLLNLMLAGKVDAVVVWAVDRLTRRLVDLEQIITICETTRVRLATVTGDLDLSTDTGRMLARILASVARGEVERKGARQRRANEQRANGGHMGWATRPFGYDRLDGHVVVVKAEAEALQDVARLLLAGSTLAASVRLLDERGLTTTAGKPWNATSLRRALQSRRYSGRVVYNGADVAEGTWPVILDAETQDRLAEVLRDVRRRLQQGTEAKHLLSGLARCGRCGAALYATKGTGHLTYKCPSCRLARRVSQVDELVEEVVIGRLSRPDAASIFSADTDLDALRAEVVDLRDRRDGLVELMADGLLSRDAVAQQAGRLTRRITEVESRITAALGDSPVARLVDAADVTAAWEMLDVRSRKAVVDALMTVTVLPAGRGARFALDQVRIEWVEER
jgi:site-specific DNA recombinase